MPTLAQNRKARHDYDILETYEAGLVLTGGEVKSAKAGRINLQGAFVVPKGQELWLTGCHITAYAPAAGFGASPDPLRDRKLLLKHNELQHLAGKVREQGLTLVPLSMYTAHRFVKVELALARGRARHDKRAAIKRRELEREVRKRTLTRA